MPRNFEEFFRRTDCIWRFTGDFACELERRLQWIGGNAGDET